MQNKRIHSSFKVEYTYELHFTKQLFSPENGLLADLLKSQAKKGPVKVIVVADQGVIDAHSGLEAGVANYARIHEGVLDVRKFIAVTGGEGVKNTSVAVNRILDAINNQHICRHSFVLVIGGGAVIDMAGYAAAIAHRGIRLIRIPTTVLSQNDAAVGVKNGINVFEKKNFVGTFSPPYAIINDAEFLTTLDDRDWRAGIAEAIKVALLKDAAFFKFIEGQVEALSDRDLDTMQHLIYRCAELHMEHIARGGDPFELGSSRPLDFGHWSAHKLEQMTNYSLRHGEAVAMGIALDVGYAVKKGFLDAKEAERIWNLMEKLGFDLRLPLSNKKAIDTLLEGIEEFREHLGGELTITLLSEIGTAMDVHEIDRDLMRESIMKQVQADNQSVA